MSTRETLPAARGAADAAVCTVSVHAPAHSIERRRDGRPIRTQGNPPRLYGRSRISRRLQWLAVRWPDVFDREILVVTGKGGTGKSTVAAALAVAAANAGRRVLLTDVEGRREIAGTLGVSDPGYQETAI